jgi:hypothetical protein
MRHLRQIIESLVKVKKVQSNNIFLGQKDFFCKKLDQLILIRFI